MMTRVAAAAETETDDVDDDVGNCRASCTSSEPSSLAGQLARCNSAVKHTVSHSAIIIQTTLAP